MRKPREKICFKFVVWTVFKVLGRGIKGAVKIDSSARSRFDEFPEGFVFRLTVLPKGPSLVLKKGKKNFKSLCKRKAAKEKIDLDIQFKHLPATLPVVLGISGVTQAYAENRFVMKGEIGDSMMIVDIMNLTEAYLFPKFIVSRFMDKVPKRQKSMLRAYLYVLTGI